MATQALIALSADAKLSRGLIERRALRPNDVSIAIKFCGICHSDLHMAQGHWPVSAFPCVPGHEIVGIVTATGADVSAFASGDVVAVGCMVDSCRTCVPCQGGLEQFCQQEFTSTYGSLDRVSGELTMGGYSTDIVVDGDFVLPVSHKVADLAGVAPLVCAGVTMWSPMRKWGVGPGSKVGIVGLGGLGHIGIKLAKELGAHVTLFTSSQDKIAIAQTLGADATVLTSQSDGQSYPTAQLDLILNTAAVAHELTPYIECLALDGVMVMVGLPPDPDYHFSVYDLILHRRQLTGSHIGSVQETRELLGFCAQRGIVCDVELIGPDYVTDIFDQLAQGQATHRYVLDVSRFAS